ncbi:MAG: hypothetical protein V4754_22050 [Pseudomonadota bacterium]
MSELVLSNGRFGLQLTWQAASAALVTRLRAFLTPYFAPCAGPDTPPVDLRIDLLPAEQFGQDWRARCTIPFALRASSAAMFNLNVVLGQDGQAQLAWDPLRAVGYRIDAGAARVAFYGDDAAFIHLIELVRYYGLLVEQAKGSVVLHSAAVIARDGEQVHAIVGPKGAGKTTTMLAMIASGHYRYFSGDKVLLDLQDGVLRARGWPDYPHVGLGTLRQHPVLAARLGVAFSAPDGSALSDRHKVLIDPALLMASIETSATGSGRLGALILPSVDTDGDGSQRALGAAEKDGVSADQLFEWPHEFGTARWHGIEPAGLDLSKQVPPAIAAALRATPWYHVFGKPLRQAA